MTTLPAGWMLVPIEPTDDMETAAENDYEQRGETFPDWKAKYRAMLAAAPTPPASAQPARDWELDCDHCNGSGHVFVKHQVAELTTDVQEFKEECECCEGRGFVFAFQDIPGIAEYVKSCRSGTQDAPITVSLDSDPRGVSVGVWQGSRCIYNGAHVVPAPAAGDARGAAVGAAIERACAELPFGYSIELFVEAGYGGARLVDPEDGEIDLDQDERDLAREINAGIDAAIAAQQGKGGEA